MKRLISRGPSLKQVSEISFSCHLQICTTVDWPKQLPAGSNVFIV